MIVGTVHLGEILDSQIGKLCKKLISKRVTGRRIMIFT